MLDRFISAPTLIAVLTLTTSTFAEEKTAPVPLKPFLPATAAKPATPPATATKPAAPPTAAKKPTTAPSAATKPATPPAEATKLAAPPPAVPKPEGEPKPAATPGPTTLSGAGAKPAEAAESEPEAARAILVTKREITAQLQIFLDQQLFSPGMIDGKQGKTVTKAFKRWQRAHGFPETGVIDENVPLDSVYPVYTFHTVSKGDLKFIGELPRATAEQAKRKYLPYSSYLEFLAERYHAGMDFLTRLNPGVQFSKLQPGDQVRVPNVAPFKIEEMPPTGNLPPREEYKNRRIVISRQETMLDLFDGENLIASIPIAPGSPAHPTPPGKWRILGIASMPTFRWDKGVLNRGVRTKDFYMLPAGPRNPVGVAWIGLNKPGIGIHGTNNPYSIGTFASHGCMRTANWDISRIGHLLTTGVTVEIQ